MVKSTSKQLNGEAQVKNGMPFWGVRVNLGPGVFSTGFIAYIKRGLSESERASILLTMTKVITINYESNQEFFGNTIPGIRKSGFSAEDLPSNLLGFYAHHLKINKAQVEDLCNVVQSVDTNLSIFNEIGGSLGFNRSFKPISFHDGDNPKSNTAKCYCNKDLMWPNEFNSVEDAPRPRSLGYKEAPIFQEGEKWLVQ